MREKILEEIASALAQRGKDEFFIREQDIQLYLAHYFTNRNSFDRVHLEYHVPSSLIKDYPWADSSNIYIDIVLEENGKFYPIEIKYKTATQTLPRFIFNHDTSVTLRQHGAQNIGCYDFWKDIKRIELFEQVFQSVERGVVLFVSNDATYRSPPSDPNVGYAPFSIHQGRSVPMGSCLKWNGDLAVAHNRPELSIKYTYDIHWSQIDIPQHHYVLI